MSAGHADPQLSVSRDLGLLAPKFRQAVESAIAECRAQDCDAYVYEAYRSNALQQIYYARGRSVIPPLRPVTNAASNLHSWHGYGLAVDVISASRGWNQPESWFKKVAGIFYQFDCKWGGDWTKPDLPHFQWGLCKPSPSDQARALLQSGGMESVWAVLKAA